jgi:hypothetical protein
MLLCSNLVFFMSTWPGIETLFTHTLYMSEEPLASDLEKAHLILGEFGLPIGPAGAMSDVIARAVAAGIALGRKEALLAEARRDDQQASKA